MAMNNRDRWGDTYANNTTKKMIALYDYDPQVSFLEYCISFEHNLNETIALRIFWCYTLLCNSGAVSKRRRRSGAIIPHRGCDYRLW